MRNTPWINGLQESHRWVQRTNLVLLLPFLSLFFCTLLFILFVCIYLQRFSYLKDIKCPLQLPTHCELYPKTTVISKSMCTKIMPVWNYPGKLKSILQRDASAPPWLSASWNSAHRGIGFAAGFSWWGKVETLFPAWGFASQKDFTSTDNLQGQNQNTVISQWLGSDSQGHTLTRNA